nr:MAG TPA: hypothetical protein [Bacteriophage sp.]
MSNKKDTYHKTPTNPHLSSLHRILSLTPCHCGL